MHLRRYAAVPDVCNAEQVEVGRQTDIFRMMSNSQTISDWLVKTLFGLLLIAVVGCAIFAVLWKPLRCFLNWFVNVVPPTFRSLSRKATEQQIVRLERLNNDCYQIILEVILQSGIGLFNCVVYCFVVFLAMSALYHLYIPFIHRDIRSTFVLASLNFSFRPGLVISMGFLAASLTGLYRDMHNYDMTMQKLNRHIAELDAKRR